MNKFMKVLAASALIATALVGCGGDAAAKYAKAGLGVVSSFDEKTGEVNSTFAAVGLDKDGKVQYINLDVAQSTPGGEEKKVKTQSKKDLKEAYGMKGASAKEGKIKDGAEWDQQAAVFEKFCKGKTADEIAKVETEPFHGGKAPKTGTDLAAGCTIVIDDFLAAVAKAVANAQDVAADDIKLGYVMSNDAKKKQLNTTLALMAYDADGKVLYSKIDVAQIYKNEDGKVITDTKSELKDGYGMKGASAAAGKIKDGAEWDQQAAAFEKFCKGKTAAEIAKVETEPFHGGKAPKTGTDLATGCTIVIDDFLAAIAGAK